MITRCLNVSHFFITVIVYLINNPLSANTIWTEGLSEDQQYQLMQGLFEDHLYYSVQELTAGYLQFFPEGKYREESHFLRARAAEQSGKFPQQALALYQDFLKQYPQSAKVERSLLDIGILYSRLAHYIKAIESLKEYFQRFPNSPFLHEGHYWLGYALFYQGEKHRSAQENEQAQSLLKEAELHLTHPALEKLSDDLALEKFYLMGWTAQHLGNKEQAHIFLLKYAQKTENAERASLIYYQLGINQRQAAYFEEAQQYFATITKLYPNSPLYVPSLFWKTEMAYAVYIEGTRKKEERATLSLSDVRNRLITGYQNYLATKDTAYLPTSYFRLGLLHQEESQNEKAIEFFKQYLATKDQNYVGASHFRLGQLWATTQPEQAIVSLKTAADTEEYRHHAPLIQLLAELYEQTKKLDQKRQLLIKAKTNEVLTPQQRLFFQVEYVNMSFKQDRCKEVLTELKKLPLGTQPSEENYLLYMRGSCFLQLSQQKEAQSDFEQDLTQLTPQQLDLRENIVLKLTEIYSKQKAYQKLASLYETHLMPYLKDGQKTQKYALYLGQIYYTPLEQLNESLKWLKRADSGGVTDTDMQAVILISLVENKSGKLASAIQTLTQAEKRSLQKTPWYISLHYELGSLLVEKKDWKKALAQYELVVKHPASSEEDSKKQKIAKSQIQEIETFLTDSQLNDLVKKKSWKQVTQLIYKEIKTGPWAKNADVLSTLVLAENELKNWKGIIEAHDLLKKLDVKRANTLEMLLIRGLASEQLKDLTTASTYYDQAIASVAKEDTANRIYLTEKLGAIYLQRKDYTKMVKLYEQNYALLKDKKDQSHFAFVIGYHYLNTLKQVEPGRSWLTKVDLGGTEEEELNAVFLLAELENQSKQPQKAIQLLTPIAKRNIPNQSPWYLLVHYQLGTLHHALEQWEFAKKHYDLAAKTKKIKGYEEYQKSAQDLAKEIGGYLKSIQSQ